MTVDTVMRAASATKLVTTVAAMLCVDRGLIGLDDEEVINRVEELRGIQVIKGYDGDKPILEDPKTKITLRSAFHPLHFYKARGADIYSSFFRRLLTHTSGFCYDAFSPLTRKMARNPPPGITTRDPDRSFSLSLPTSLGSRYRLGLRSWTGLDRSAYRAGHGNGFAGLHQTEYLRSARHDYVDILPPVSTGHDSGSRRHDIEKQGDRPT